MRDEKTACAWTVSRKNFCGVKLKKTCGEQTKILPPIADSGRAHAELKIERVKYRYDSGKQRYITDWEKSII